MRKLANVLTLCALAAPLAVLAQDNAAAGGEHSEHEQHAAQPGSASGNESNAGMHEHMRAMREQMARIRTTEDAAERDRLMHEHTQSMQQHMQMMSSTHPEPGAAGPSRCAEGDAACRMAELRAENGMARERMRGLEDRLASIEQLLQQMLEHQRVEEAENSSNRRERDRRR